MKKILSFFLALMLIVSVAVPVFAASSDDDDTVKVKKVTIYAPMRTVKVGRTLTLEERIYPDDADYDDVSWDSSNFNIAEVDEYGEVTGVSPGTATITVRVYLGNKRKGSASIEITVPGGSSSSEDETSSSSKSSASKSDSTGSSSSGGKISAAEVTSAVKKNVKKGASSSASFKGYSSVSAASLRSAALAMNDGGGTVLLNFDTVNGKAVEGRLTINPNLASSLTSDIQLGVYTNDSATSKAKSTLQKYFKNDFALVKASQQGSYGMNVDLAVKISSGIAKSKNLKLYSYDNSTNKYKEIKDANIRVDSKNYAHFTTNLGDYLVISDGPMVSK